ncbi:MAG: cyclic nucleotide-binding domain-containing protein [Thermodesulfobacteriota bacterium]
MEIIKEFWHKMDIQVWLGLVIVFVLYWLTTALFNRFFRKNSISKASLRFVKWLFLLAGLYVCDFIIFPALDVQIPYNLFFLVKLLVIWILIKSFLDGFYTEVYLKRIRKKKVNFIVLDFFKLLVFCALIILLIKNVFQVNPGSILTSSAILTAIIGLSIQDTIGSLISGLLIQIEKPFKLGDWISVADLEGKVVDISWRYTKIEAVTLDYIMIPNNSISRDTLVNYSQPISKVMRILDVGASYEAPPIKVKQALIEVISKVKLVENYPRPVVRLNRYEDFRIIYRIIFYVRNFEDMWQAWDELYTSIWYQFKKTGIDISMPRQDVYLKKEQKESENKEILEMLQNLTLFSGLSYQELNLLVRSSIVRTYPPEACIICQGDDDNNLFVIVSGEVTVLREEKVLARLGPGDFFGEMALLTGEPRSADIHSADKMTCLIIDREAFRVLLEMNSAVYNNIYQLFEERSQQISPRMQGKDKSSTETLFEKFKNIFSQ